MKLTHLQKNQGWLFSQWELARPVSWEEVCRMGLAVYRQLAAAEVLIDDRERKLREPEDLLDVMEASALTVRGYYRPLKAPVKWVWYNQLSTVNGAVGCTTLSLRWAGQKRLAALLAPLEAVMEQALTEEEPTAKE